MKIDLNSINPKQIIPLEEEQYKEALDLLISIESIEEFIFTISKKKTELKSEKSDLNKILTILNKIDDYLRILLEKIEISNLTNDFKIDFYTIQCQIKVLVRSTIRILSVKRVINLYKSIDQMLKIIVFCDDFEVLADVMQVIYKYFSEDTVSKQDYEYIDKEIELLLYLTKFILYHKNSFNNDNQYKYVDYFYDDPKYCLLENKNPIFNKNSEDLFEFYDPQNHQKYTIFIKKHYFNNQYYNIFDLTEKIIKENQLENKIKYEKKDNLSYENRFFYGLLIRLKFFRMTFSLESRMSSIALVMTSLQVYVSFTKVFSIDRLDVLNKVFIVNLDFAAILKDVLDLFYLKLNSPFHIAVIQTILNILSMDEHFDFKEYMNQINSQYLVLQKMLKDCLVRKNPENPQKTIILSEETAFSPKFLNCLLQLLKKEIKQFFLDEENNIITSHLYNMCTLLGSLLEIIETPLLDSSKSVYTYNTLYTVAEILDIFIPNQDLLSNYNLLEKMIKRLENDLIIIKNSNSSIYYQMNGKNRWDLLQIDQVYNFVEFMLKLLDSPFIRKLSTRNQMVPSLARKIAESSLLTQLKELILINSKHTEKIFFHVTTLVGDIAREIPGLIDNLMENGIMEAILIRIEQEIPKDVETIPMIIYFLNMLCLSENGRELEKKKKGLKKVFNLFLEREYLDVLSQNIGNNGNRCASSMAYEFLEMINSVDKIKPKLVKLINKTMKTFIEKTKDFSSKLNLKFGKEADQIQEEINFCSEKEFVKMIQNFLKFFSRFFSANSNIVDELSEDNLAFGSFLELIHNSIYLVSDRPSFVKTICNTFKSITQVAYKIDYYEKLKSEILNLIKKIEDKTGSNLENLTNSESFVPSEIALLLRNSPNLEYSKEISEIPLEIINNLTDLQYLEFLIELLKYTSSSRDIEDNSDFDFLNKLGHLGRLSSKAYEEENIIFLSKNENNKSEFFIKLFENNHDSIFLLTRKVYLASMRDSMDEEKLKNYIKLISNTLNNSFSTTFTDQNLMEISLLRDFHHIYYYKELLVAFLDNLRKNNLHPVFVLLMEKYENYSKLFEFIKGFINLVQIKEFIGNLFIIEIINRIQKEIIDILKSILFLPVDSKSWSFIELRLRKREGLKPQIEGIYINHLNKIKEILHVIQLECLSNNPTIKEILTIINIHSLKLLDFNFVEKNNSKNHDKLIENLSQMGFSNERIRFAMDFLDTTDANIITEWLLSNVESNKNIETIDSPLKTKNITLILDFKKELMVKMNEIHEFLLRNLLFFHGLERTTLDFMLKLVEKQENEDLKKKIIVNSVYLILRAMKNLVSFMFKTFKFKIGQKANRELLDRIKDEGEIMKLDENLINSDFNTKLRTFTSLISFLVKLAQKACNYHAFKNKFSGEFLKLSEKILQKINENMENAEEELVYTDYQDYFNKFLIFLGQITLNQNIEDKKNSKLVTDSDKVILQGKILSFLGLLLSLANNLKEKKGIILLNKGLLKGILTITSKIVNNNNEMAKNFILKGGLTELFKLKSIDIKDLLEDYRLLFENLAFADDKMRILHIESEIKHILKEKNDFLFADFFETFKKKYPENPDFPIIVKKICQKQRKSSDLDKKLENYQVSLKPSIELSTIHSFSDDLKSNKTSWISLYQPLSLNYLYNFNSEGTLISLLKINQGKKSGHKDLAGNNSPEKKLQSTLKKNTISIAKKSKDNTNIGNLVINFTFSESLNSFLGIIIDNIVQLFILEVNNNVKNTENSLNYPDLIRLLHALIHKYPILSLFIVKYNIKKLLKNCQNEKILRLVNLGNLNSNFKEISFLSFMTRVVPYYTVEKFRHLLYELSLDKYIYISVENNKGNKEFVNFASEIRKKILTDIYIILENEYISLNFPENLKNKFEISHIIMTYSSLHFYLMSIKEIVKSSARFMSLETEYFGLNFSKIYEEILKNQKLSDFYAMETRLPILYHTISALYQYILAFSVSKKGLNLQDNQISTIIKRQIMPSGILFKSGLLSKDWEFMMNPTLSQPTEASNHSANDHIIQMAESSSDYSEEIEIETESIDTVLDEIYQIDRENHAQNPLENEEDEESESSESIEHSYSNNEENIENMIEDDEDYESFIDENENREDISESDSESENLGGNRSSETSSISESSSLSEGSSIEIENLPGNRERQGREGEEEYYIDEENMSSESESIDYEAEERIREDNQSDSEESEENRHSGGLLGSLNLLFRRDRTNRRNDGRRWDKQSKKEEKDFRKLNSVITFDYLEFDQEFQELNNLIIQILTNLYMDNNIKYESSSDLQIIRQMTDIKPISETIFSEEEWIDFLFEHPIVNNEVLLQNEQPLRIEGLNLFRNNNNSLNVRQLFISSPNEMVMVVSNDNQESGISDLNLRGQRNQNQLEMARVRENSSLIGNLFSNLRRSATILHNDHEREREEQLSPVHTLNEAQMTEIRDAIFEDMESIEENIEEEEKKENNNNENPEKPEEEKQNKNINSPQMPVDPLFLDALSNELKEGLPHRSQPALSENKPPFSVLDSEFSNAMNPPTSNLNQIIVNTDNNQISSVSEMDNAYFFASLPPELREEVLLTSDPEFLGTLPPDILQDYQEGLRNRERLHLNMPIFSRISEEDLEESKHNNENHNHNKEKNRRLKDKKILSLHKQKEQICKSINGKLILVDDKLIIHLLSLLYTDSLSFRDYPFSLFKILTIHPSTEIRILETLMSILKKEKIEIFEYNFPPDYILERDFILKNEERVFEMISLKILAILTVFTKQSVGFFIENSKKNGKNALSELVLLLGEPKFKNSYIHLKLLISVIYNIVRKTSILMERNSKRPDYNDDKFRLDIENIRNICEIVNFSTLDEVSLKNLNTIISVFSMQNSNLQGFIEQIKLILLEICSKMNICFEGNLSQLRVSQESLVLEDLLLRIESEINEEQRIYRIFKIVKKLFEKCLTGLLSKSNENSTETRKKCNEEIREIFKTLINERALNEVWINVTEILTILNTVYPNSINLSNPIIHKTIPILESFFIIYRIMHDDESFEQLLEKERRSNVSRNYLKYFNKRSVEISGLIHNPLENVKNEEENRRDFKFLKQKVDFDEMFTIMCEENKNVINMMVRQNISILNESFSMIIKKMPKILDFENKKTYFRSELKKIKGTSFPSLRLKVRRNNVFIDSYNVFRNLSTEELRRKLVIEFTNEPGIDQGGLIREFYCLLSKEIFNTGYCLFMTSANNVTFQPSPQSNVNDQHLSYFKFVGRIFGKALHDGFLMDAFFTRSFYKHMLGQSLTIYDMEDIDPGYFRNLKWILENEITHLDLTFSYEADNFGKLEVIELIENGQNIPVTEENKLDYVQKICYAKMAKDIQEQIKKFLEGFHELIPSALVSIFDSRELELMISGLPDIDIQDLKENTIYTNYGKDHKVIVWFWEVLNSLDKTDKAAFLQFVTGTSKVPIDGFKGLKGANGPQKFNIQKCFDSSKLPTSHTCFNQLDLPEYSSKEILRERLLTSIREGKEFGFM